MPPTSVHQWMIKLVLNYTLLAFDFQALKNRLAFILICQFIHLFFAY